jgi:hypothetical protein
MGPQISQSAAMRRDDICIYVSPANRTRLTALMSDRNTPSKVVWRAKIVLATADGYGTWTRPPMSSSKKSAELSTPLRPSEMGTKR